MALLMSSYPSIVDKTLSSRHPQTRKNLKRRARSANYLRFPSVSTVARAKAIAILTTEETVLRSRPMLTMVNTALANHICIVRFPSETALNPSFAVDLKASTCKRYLRASGIHCSCFTLMKSPMSYYPEKLEAIAASVSLPLIDVDLGEAAPARAPNN